MFLIWGHSYGNGLKSYIPSAHVLILLVKFENSPAGSKVQKGKWRNVSVWGLKPKTLDIRQPKSSASVDRWLIYLFTQLKEQEQ